MFYKRCSNLCLQEDHPEELNFENFKACKSFTLLKW